MRQKLSVYIPPYVKISVHDSQGDVRYAQNYSDYLSNPNADIQIGIYGPSLIQILIQESYINEKLQLNHILTNDPHGDASRLIGSIAESLVVDWCNRYPDVNRTLGTYARSGQRETKTLDRYIAVATDSLRTKALYRQYYNPKDTQRDILWVDKDDTDNQLLAITPGQSRSSAKPAGLQVKASHDGMKYVFPNIEDYHYPILYFDLNGDWGVVRKAIMETHKTSILIHPDEIQREIKSTLKGYFDIVVKVINRELSIERVIQDAKYYGDSVLSTGLDTAYVNDSISQIILPSRF